MKTQVRTRFAPSPTGFLHVGGARTALFNYLYAKSQGGKYILRIEDTDQERSTETSYVQVIESLKWLGLGWDEGPELGGAYGPYKQSDRLHIYKEKAEELVRERYAYFCFCTTEELEKKKKQREAMGLPPVYDGKCRSLTNEEVEHKLKAGAGYTIRFRCPPGEVLVQDMVQGDVRFDTSLIGDFIIVKSDGYASYNFAVVVDDFLMDITHVIRGVGHLSNTPRQIMIYNAFSWRQPAWAHVSEIVGSDHKKLSKRHGATPITAFRDLGYTARAFNNYMALLGWSTPDGNEFQPMNELEKIFDVSRCNKSPSMFDVFDLEKAQEVDLAQVNVKELETYLFGKSKLNWLSNQHIRATENEQYINEVMPYVIQSGLLPAEQANKDNQNLCETLLSLRVYLDYYSQIAQYLQDFYGTYDVSVMSHAELEWAESEKFLLLANTFKRHIEQIEGEFTADKIKMAMQTTGKNTDTKGKPLFMSLRVASTGKAEGLELHTYLALLGKEKVLKRISQVTGRFQGK